MRLPPLLLSLLLFMLLAAGPARADIKQSAEPILRVETGMHTAVIRGIDGDVAGRYIVTAGDDKTARVWEAATGRLLQVLRPPIGAGNEGKLFAVAISPDGRFVAVGGWTELGSAGGGHAVYLFNRASGRMLRAPTGLPQVIDALAFSPNGNSLAVGLGGANGIRVWRVADGAELLADRDYGGDVYGLSWDTKGRLVAGSYDGDLRLYDVNLQQLARRTAPSGKNPYHIAFNPDGSAIAVGYYDSARVDVLSGADLTPRFQPDTAGIDNGNLFSIGWSADGQSLYAGGRWWSGGEFPLRRWDRGGRGPGRDLPVGTTNTIAELKSRAGVLLLAAADPAWMRLDADGKRQAGQGPVTIDMRNKLRDAFTVSADGRRVRFGLDNGGGRPALFDLTTRQMTDAPQPLPDLMPARTDAPGPTITDWENTRTPRLNGQPLALAPYEWARSLAIAPDGQGFVLGAEWWLRAYRRDGSAAAPPKPMPGAVRGANFTGDGRLVITALDDGTIRWYRASDLTELLALFVHADGQRWVAWTPSGYYLAGPGGEDMIGWQVNNGPDQAADFFPASRFRDRFNRPDIVDLVLTTLDEADAVRQADAAANRRQQQQQDLRRTLPPLVEILSPGDGDDFTTETVTLRYRTRSPSGKPVTSVRVLLDGRPPEEAKGTPRVEPDGDTGGRVLALPPHDLTLSVYAETADGAGPAASIRLRWTGRTVRDYSKPILYALLSGVSNYDNPDYRLRYAAKDARDLEVALRKQKGGLYADVVVNPLPDASRDELLKGLLWLAKNATGNDVALLFISGHATQDADTDYWFLTRDADRDNLPVTAIAKGELTAALRRVKGRAVYALLDTCHAGALALAGGYKSIPDMNGLVNELQSQDLGIQGIASSTGKQLSREDPAWGNGAMTKAVLEGLAGAADGNKDGVIRLPELYGYVAERVRDLTHGQQHPVGIGPDGLHDAPVALPRP